MEKIFLVNFARLDDEAALAALSNEVPELSGQLAHAFGEILGGRPGEVDHAEKTSLVWVGCDGMAVYVVEFIGDAQQMHLVRGACSSVLQRAIALPIDEPASQEQEFRDEIAAALCNSSALQ